MNVFRMLCVTGTLITIAGCHRDTTPTPIAPQKNEGVIPQAQLDALNKTKALDSTLQQAEQQRQEQINQ